MSLKKRSYTVIIFKDIDIGGYVACVPELPGCFSQGESLEECVNNIKEAIELYLETLGEEEKEEDNLEFVGIQKIDVTIG